MVHSAGALAWVDAVHAAPHLPLTAVGWECDFLVCSAYKFFGPHVGVLYGRGELLERFTPYKVRPAPEVGPERWMTGTQPLELIWGAAEAVEYLADLGREAEPAADNRREALAAAWRAIVPYERDLSRRLLAGLAELPPVSGLGESPTSTVWTNGRRRFPSRIAVARRRNSLGGWESEACSRGTGTSTP